jgi:UDP-GlcNAc:undecaprenyl-phosphate GlcNAc-1-phosphate transferase
MNFGLGARGVDGVLYLLQIVLGILVFVSIRFQRLGSRGALSLLFLGTAYLVSVGFFVVIHFVNRQTLKKNDA